MTKRLIATGVLAVLMALIVPSAAPAAPSTTAPAPVVVLVLAPYLRWDDVLSGNMPATLALAGRSAVANLNVRSLLPDTGQPSPDGGALMLSAGTWARYDASGAAPEETTGTQAVVFPGLAGQQRANAGEDVDIRLGTLGQAILDAGGWTAAIGNGDADRPSRPAALVAMDAQGRVPFGDVSREMVTAEGAAGAPLGRVSDAARVKAVLADVLRDGLKRGRGPALIVIDPGDLARAHVAGGNGPDGLERSDRLAALAAFDELVGALPNLIPKDALLIVAAPVAAEVAGEPSGFGPLIVSGDAWGPGGLTSPSTHRAGLVTAADLTATILAALGVREPAQVAGSAVTSARAPFEAQERMQALARADAFMRAVDAARPRVVGWFILASVGLVGVCAVLAVVRVPPLLARTGQIALLGVLSVPVASLLMYLVVYLPQSPGLVVALLFATAAVLWTVDATTQLTRVHPRPLTVLALLTAGVVMVDQWTGARLSLDGLLGYSPLVGARFYGMGNEAAALMVGGAITGCALFFDAYAGQDWMARVRPWLFPAVATIGVFTAAAPMIGANAGVAVWGTAAFALGWWGMAGKRIDARAVIAVFIAAAVLVAGFTALDVEGRTHLGRAAATAGDAGPAALWTMVQRKAATNIRLSRESVWSPLFLVLLAVLAYVRVRPRGAMRDLLMEWPSFAAALAASLVAAVVSYFTEDSGVIVPALLLLFPAVAVVYLMLGVSVVRRGAGR